MKTDWTANVTKLTYAYPICSKNLWQLQKQARELLKNTPPEHRHIVGPFWTDLSPETHNAEFTYAIDFIVPVNTPICAAEEGVIEKVVEHHSTYGNDKKYANSLNYITIRHKHQEFSQYAHIQDGSVTSLGLYEGSLVKRGQQIGMTGRNGWMNNDHLHFLIFQNDSNPAGFKSLRVKFSPTMVEIFRMMLSIFKSA